MAQLYSYENFPQAAVERLRELGHNIVTTAERSQANLEVPDEAVLQFAIQEQRAVLTLNRKDFIRLHKQHPAHFGIIVCTVDNHFVALANRIHAEISSLSNLQNQLIRINRPNT
jgi:predicted nuclease of predicted toxin-antitoxin system